MLSLIEFSKSQLFKVHVDHSFKESQLTLKFDVQGPVHKLYDRAPMTNLKKGEDLWKKTCLEAFFFEEGTTTYTELNFNIFGEYSFLSFKDYRKADTNSEKMECLDIRVQFKDDGIEAECHLKIAKNLRLILSPTALLMPKECETLYFALNHAEKPDFHSQKTIQNRAPRLLT